MYKEVKKRPYDEFEKWNKNKIRKHWLEFCRIDSERRPKWFVYNLPIVEKWFWFFEQGWREGVKNAKRK